MALESSSVQQSQEIPGPSAGLGYRSDSVQLQSNRDTYGIDTGVSVAQSIASQESGAPNPFTGEALLVVAVFVIILVHGLG